MNQEFDVFIFGKGFGVYHDQMKLGVDKLLEDEVILKSGKIDVTQHVKNIVCKKYLWNYIQYLWTNNKTRDVDIGPLTILGRVSPPTLNGYTRLVKTHMNTEKITKKYLCKFINRIVDKYDLKIPFLHNKNGIIRVVSRTITTEKRPLGVMRKSVRKNVKTVSIITDKTMRDIISPKTNVNISNVNANEKSINSVRNVRNAINLNSNYIATVSKANNANTNALKVNNANTNALKVNNANTNTNVSKPNSANTSKANNANALKANNVNASKPNNANATKENNANASKPNNGNSSKANNADNSSKVNNADNSSKVNNVNASKTNTVNTSKANNANASKANTVNTSKANNANAKNVNTKNVNANKPSNANNSNVSTQPINANTTNTNSKKQEELAIIKEELTKIENDNKELEEKIKVLQENQLSFEQQRETLEPHEKEKYQELEIKELKSELLEQEKNNIIKLNELKKIIFELKNSRNDTECKEILDLMKLELANCKMLRDRVDTLSEITTNIDVNMKPELKMKLENPENGSKGNSVTLKLKQN